MSWIKDLLPHSNSSGLHYLSEIRENPFESQYIKVRKDEGRIYSNEIVRTLPLFPLSSPLHKEWRIRAFSANQLIKHLSQRLTNSSTLLELGCGNGWLSNHLQAHLNCSVLGVDMNKKELEQATSVFGREQLQFAYLNIFEPTIAVKSIDVIVVAAAIQYFSDFNQLINRLIALLKPNGEIHIIDSPFYTSAESVINAQTRTANYYTKNGVPALTEFYHHHRWKELEKYKYTIHYAPTSFLNKIKRKLGSPNSPFPWISIHESL